MNHHPLLLPKGLLAAIAAASFLSVPFAAQAQRIWDGETSGDWTDPDNWDGNTTIPSAGNALQFGLATTYAVTNSPSTNFGTLTFLSTAGANYTLSGNAVNNEIYGNVTVQGSASATNHTINNQFRLNNKTFDIQSTSTSLTLNAFDFGGSGRTLTKNGAGTLILATTGNNPGVLAVNAGILDIRATQGDTNGALRLSGTTAAAIVTKSTSGLVTLGLGAATEATAASYAGQVTGNINLRNGLTTANSGVTQTFTSASVNTYVGTTTINAGSLIINGTHTGGDNYSVLSRTTAVGSGFADGRLAGSGTIVLANDTKSFSFTGFDSTRRAILNPGADGTDTTTLTLGSAGIATTVNLNNFSVLRLDIGAAGASDRVSIFGDLNLNAGSSLDLLSLAGAWDNSTYTIATFTGALIGTFGSITGLDPGYQINYGSNDITLSLIPEPSAGLLLLGGMGMLTLLRRRRRF